VDDDNPERSKDGKTGKEPINSERAKPVYVGLGYLIFAIILIPWDLYNIITAYQQGSTHISDYLYSVIGLIIGIACLSLFIRLVKRKGLRETLSEGEWM